MFDWLFHILWKIRIYSRIFYFVIYVMIMILFARRFDLKSFTRYVRKMILLYHDIEYFDKEKIQMVKDLNEKGRGVLLMMNHHSGLDPVFLYDFVDFYSVAKSDFIGSLDGVWLFDYVKEEFFERCQCISYKRGDKKSGQEVKDTIAKIIEKGKNVIVFPEGECQHCFMKPKDFRNGIFELAFEKNIPIFSMSINYSKDIGSSRHEPVDIVDTFEKSPDVRLYMNGLYMPKNYKDFEELKKEVYDSISENVLLEWN